jgi:hypothetical protein
MAEPLQKPPLIPFGVRVGQRMRQETKAVVDEQLPSEMAKLLGRLAEADPAAEPKRRPAANGGGAPTVTQRQLLKPPPEEPNDPTE